MAKGKKCHLKRLQAPKSWHLSKMNGIFAPNTVPGPHKKRESVPLVVLLRNLLGYAKNAAEAKIIAARGHVLINGKARTEIRFPVGLMDVIHFPSLKRSFRLIINTKGNFSMVNPSYSENFNTGLLPQETIEDNPLFDLFDEENKDKKVDEIEVKSEEQLDQQNKESPNNEEATQDLSSAPSTDLKGNNRFSNLEESGKGSVTFKKTSKSASFIKKSSSDNKKEVWEYTQRDLDGMSCIIPCKVRMVGEGNKKMVGENPAGMTEKERMIPFLTTECGRILKYVDKGLKKGDTVFVKLTSEKKKAPKKYQVYAFNTKSEIIKSIAFEEGKLAMVQRGRNVGRVGFIKRVEKHARTTDVVYLEDEKNQEFVVGIKDLFVIGDKKSEIGLTKDRGVKMTLEEKVKYGLQAVEARKNN